MKQFLFTLTACCIALISEAQIGIGTTTPNASAELDITSTNKGFLPPRIALTATTSASPVTSPATGLLVYNTATSGTAPNNVTPGYYYYNGTKWQRIIHTEDATVQKSVVSGYFSGSYTGNGPNTLTCTEVADVYNNFSSNTFTAPRTGYYLVTANLTNDGGRQWWTGEVLRLFVTVNSVVQANSNFYHTTTYQPTYSTSIVVSAVLPLSAGDLLIFQQGKFGGVGSSFDFNSIDGNRFSITEL